LMSFCRLLFGNNITGATTSPINSSPDYYRSHQLSEQLMEPLRTVTRKGQAKSGAAFGLSNGLLAPICSSASGRRTWSLGHKCNHFKAFSRCTIIALSHKINPTCPYDTTPSGRPARERCRVIHYVRRLGVRGGHGQFSLLSIFRRSGSPHITATSLMGGG